MRKKYNKCIFSWVLYKLFLNLHLGNVWVYLKVNDTLRLLNLVGNSRSRLLFKFNHHQLEYDQNVLVMFEVDYLLNTNYLFQKPCHHVVLLEAPLHSDPLGEIDEG